VGFRVYRRKSLGGGLRGSFSLAALLVAVGMGACGDSQPNKPKRPPTVAVPNVIAQKADEAVRDLERARLVATLDPEPAERSLCTVRRQSEQGRARRGTEVLLSLRCLVVVPDVTGEPTGRARAKIKEAGDVRVSFDPEEPSDATVCTVTQQDEVGRVQPGTEVVLSVKCPLTTQEVREAGERLARKTSKQGEKFAVTGCELVGNEQGRCNVVYYPPEGFECSGEIFVVLEGSAIRSDQNVDCE
jgi:hypothetical protein